MFGLSGQFNVLIAEVYQKWKHFIVIILIKTIISFYKFFLILMDSKLKPNVPTQSTNTNKI